MTTDTARDVMQVCLTGHVITDVFGTHPETGASHCDRCGAPTLSHCPTCGEEIPGAALLPGMATIGPRQPPQHCTSCGAAFPWQGIPIATPAGNALAVLEPLLRRLPCMARQLRDRHDSRPTLRVRDEHDLEDLLRAVLHLHFDDVRRLIRTPVYSAGTRTDFIVGPDPIAIAAKFVGPGTPKQRLEQEVQEDVDFYQRQPVGDRLVLLIFDPEQRLHDPRQLEEAWSRAGGSELQIIIAS